MSAGVAERRKKSVQRRVLSDDVVEYLIDAILDGTLQPGEKVVELQAARMLDVSQATVREALRELEVRGFLESRPFRGTYVRKFTIRGLQDYFRTRTELEILAARFGEDRQRDRCEQHGRRAQRDALDLEVAEGHADADQDEQQQDALLGQEMQHGIHHAALPVRAAPPPWLLRPSVQGKASPEKVSTILSQLL